MDRVAKTTTMVIKGSQERKWLLKNKSLEGEYKNRLLVSRGQACLRASERARQTREGEDFHLLRLPLSFACNMLARATILTDC